MKKIGPINHAKKIYSLTIKNSIEKVCSKLNDSIMMGIRMNEIAQNILEAMTRCFIIYCKGTFTISMTRPNQLVFHLQDITSSIQREFRTKFERRMVLKLIWDDGEIENIL